MPSRSGSTAIDELEPPPDAACLRDRRHRDDGVYGLMAKLVAGPGVRSGSASRANSHSSERVLRGSITSSTQNFSAERNGERSLLSRSSISFSFAAGSAGAARSGGG